MTTDIHSELDALPPFSNPVAYRDTWYAWAVYLSDGTSLNNHQGGHYQVRAVRA